MTPEGRVKRAIRKVLDQVRGLYVFMPVPSGFGKSSLDYVLCVGGVFIAIEAKAPGKKLTPRQKAIKRQIERAGGTVFVIDNESFEPGSPLALLGGTLKKLHREDIAGEK